VLTPSRGVLSCNGAFRMCPTRLLKSTGSCGLVTCTAVQQPFSGLHGTGIHSPMGVAPNRTPIKLHLTLLLQKHMAVRQPCMGRVSVPAILVLVLAFICDVLKRGAVVLILGIGDSGVAGGLTYVALLCRLDVHVVPLLHANSKCICNSIPCSSRCEHRELTQSSEAVVFLQKGQTLRHFRCHTVSQQCTYRWSDSAGISKHLWILPKAVV